MLMLCLISDASQDELQKKVMIDEKPIEGSTETRQEPYKKRILKKHTKSHSDDRR